MRALWLADALRAEGVSVIEVDGWQSRGNGSVDFAGVVAHHTAGPAKGDMPSLGICINGRSDLAGPLANVCLGRSGTAWIVASGRANHAGSGSWMGASGNSRFLGIEAENTGSGYDLWPAVQLDAYVRIVAGMLRALGRSADWTCGHKEYCRPTGRKVDPVPLDMARGRRLVAERLGAPPSASAPPATTTGEFTMDAEAQKAFEELGKKIDANGAGQNAMYKAEDEQSDARADAMWKRMDALNVRVDGIVDLLKDIQTQVSK